MRFVRGFRLTGLSAVALAYLLATLVTAVQAGPAAPRVRPSPPAGTGLHADGAARPLRPQTRAMVPAPRALQPAGERVGAVFTLTGRRRHFCTGSVVDSPRRNLVITAAHCVHGGAGGAYRTGLGFAPGYRDGNAPAGMWQVRSVLVAPGWAQSRDASVDVAFLVLEPLDGREVEDVVGGNPIFVDRDPGPVRLVGYPSNTDSPVACEGTAERLEGDQLRVRCPGMGLGTSGSPWFADAETTGAGSVVGVIGGYHNGGFTPDVSYSSPFGEQVAELYRQAVGEQP